MARPALSVVVPTRDRPALLASCIASIVADLSPQDEVVVVDSASRDAAATRQAALAASGGDGSATVRFVRAERPGSSVARNLGWTSARNALVAFVDDDCRVTRGWADAMVASLGRGGVSFVGGRIDVPADQQDVAQPVSVITSDEERRIDGRSRGLIGATANLGVHRPSLETVNGFDERLGRGTWFDAANDVDLIDRLLAAGCIGRYDPTVRVEHVQWRNGREHLGVHWAYGKGTGARLAKTLYRDRARARLLAPEAFRLRGVKTVATDIASGSRRNYLPGVLFRLGAVAGFAVGLVRFPGSAGVRA